MENTPSTPIEMIVTYAGLRNAYEDQGLSPEDKNVVLAVAENRFDSIKKEDLDQCGAFKENCTDYETVWDNDEKYQLPRYIVRKIAGLEVEL